MILEIDAQRELTLPDEMSDEAARQIKQWILAAEGRAQTAEAHVAQLEGEIRALRAEVSSLQNKEAPQTP